MSGSAGAGPGPAAPLVTIRAAGPADLPVLQGLFARSSLANEEDRDTLMAHPDALVLGDDGVREGRTRVAELGGRPAGFATTAPAAGGLELEDLFVEPDLMGRGIGRLLVLDAVATARAAGARRLEVTAGPQARGFYERVGFVAAGPVATRFGPALRMHRALGGDAHSSP